MGPMHYNPKYHDAYLYLIELNIVKFYFNLFYFIRLYFCLPHARRHGVLMQAFSAIATKFTVTIFGFFRFTVLTSRQTNSRQATFKTYLCIKHAGSLYSLHFSYFGMSGFLGAGCGWWARRFKVVCRTTCSLWRVHSPPNSPTSYKLTISR